MSRLECGPERSPETVIAERAQDLIVLWTQDAKKWCDVAADILTNYGRSSPHLHKQAAEAYISLLNPMLASNFAAIVAAEIRARAQQQAEEEYDDGTLVDRPYEVDPDEAYDRQRDRDLEEHNCRGEELRDGERDEAAANQLTETD